MTRGWSRHSSSIAAVSREESRRRFLLLGLSTLLLLSLGPVFGHHLAAGIEHPFHERDHVGPFCLIALHELLEPVHYLFHLLVVVGLGYAMYDRLHAGIRAKSTLAQLEQAVPVEGDAFWNAAVAVQVPPDSIRVVSGLPNPAFTAGLIRPRIYVTNGLETALSNAELSAVLAHESAHVIRRDPLRLSILRFLACTLFWIPALRRVAADVADEAEVLADDEAAQHDRLALATALLTLSGWRQPYPELGGTAAFARPGDLLERRVRRLAGETPAVGTHVTRKSLIGAFLALALVLISGAMMAHPLPVDPVSHELTHCQHPEEWAGTHLTCAAARSPDDICPHMPEQSG